MTEVEKAPEKDKPSDKSYLNKSIGAVSGMFKGWLYWAIFLWQWVLEGLTDSLKYNIVFFIFSQIQTYF